MHKVGTERTPFPVAAFRAAVSARVPLGDQEPGFPRYADELRDDQAKQLVVLDGNAVDSEKVLRRTLPCGLVHPGFCASLHGDLLRRAEAVSRALHAAMRECALGTFHHLHIVCAGNDQHQNTWFCLAHRRGAKPKIIMVVPAIFLRGDRVLDLDGCVGDSSFDYKMDQTFLAEIFKMCAPGSVEEVYWAPAPVVGVAYDTASSVQLPEDWRRRKATSEVEVFPQRPRTRPAEKDQDKWIASLHKVAGDTSTAASRHRRHRAPSAFGRPVKELPPARARSLSSSSDSAGSDSSASSRRRYLCHSSTDEELPSFAIPAAPGASRDEPPLAGQARARSSRDDGPRAARSVKFGPWSISSIFKDGEVIGWGGNCNRHANEWGRPGTKCKQAFLFVGRSSDETRCIAKQRLLMGASIPHADAQGRKGHLCDIRRGDIPIREESELDRMAATYE